MQAPPAVFWGRCPHCSSSTSPKVFSNPKKHIGILFFIFGFRNTSGGLEGWPSKARAGSAQIKSNAAQAAPFVGTLGKSRPAD